VDEIIDLNVKNSAKKDAHKSVIWPRRRNPKQRYIMPGSQVTRRHQWWRFVGHEPGWPSQNGPQPKCSAA
jgi:hypothetical protein